MKSLGPRLARRVTLAALLAFCGALHAAPSAPVVTLEGAADSSEVPYVAAPKFAASRANTDVAIHQIGDARLLDAVKEVVFSFVRTDLFWEEVQAPDGWRFGGFVSNLSARGLGALFILGYKHYMYSPDQPPTSAAQLAAFRNYVYQAAYRYRNAAVRFEMWNEQDHKDYWLAPPSPRAYRAPLETAVSAARAANPDVTIATGGVQQVDRDFIRAVGDMSANKSRTGQDAVSVHPLSPEISRDRARGLRRVARGPLDVCEAAASVGDRMVIPERRIRVCGRSRQWSLARSARARRSTRCGSS
ncbi:unnamed protein product [Candidatus Paraburkholderia kirkii UZHbot1]|uniref:WGS project CAFE00000000 data, contig bkir_c89 n=1 Tax=Candidatus Paraburkholderia kirkii UZHbot1 TaxID=1055526 RepID=U3UB56_9BURK|nr:unnamed protein product [Candidatus Paraburkholderia kirkii UZHbot1]